jgi:hypothetical protein
MFAMNPRPWKPAVELEGALDRADLPYAITLAKEISEGRHRPLDLKLAARFLPTVALQRTDDYDAWACRWFLRWLRESERPSIEQAAEISGCLADIPSEPQAVEGLQGLL